MQKEDKYPYFKFDRKAKETSGLGINNSSLELNSKKNSGPIFLQLSLLFHSKLK